VSALLLVEVIDTAGVILDAILAWIVATAFVATVCLYAAILTGAWAIRRARRALDARLRPEPPAEAPRSLPPPERAAGAHSTNPAPRKAA
jgi:hypothetical protein